MSQLWGMECANEKCVHDAITSFRLRLWIHRFACTVCETTGAEVPGSRWRDQPPQFTCILHGQRWRQGWIKQHNDIVMLPEDLDSLLAQCRDLGWDWPVVGGATVIERTNQNEQAFEPGYNRRRIVLQQEPLRRCALYFRFDPAILADEHECIRPDHVFQCVFTPGDNAQQRRTAPEIPVPVEALEHILKPNDASPVLSCLYCHHCRAQIPLRQFSSITLRSIEKGD